MKFTKLETDRLILRKFMESDLQDLYEYLSDAEVVAFEPYEAMSMNEVQVTLKERMDSHEFIAMEEKQSGKMIGNIYNGERYCGSIEIGYVLNKAYQGKGYAFEACHEVCEILFQNGAHRLEANCDPLNRSSWKLLERLGFLREGYLKKDIYFRKDEKGKPIWKDTYIYSKLSPLEYKEKNMNIKEKLKALEIMKERFEKDTLISIATVEGNTPSVRIVNSYYEDGSFYVITYLLSNKMKQIQSNATVAICGEWFTAHGVGESMGYICGEHNQQIAAKLRSAFAEWYSNGHTDESDPNTIILRIRLTEGVLLSHGTRYNLDFTTNTK